MTAYTPLHTTDEPPVVPAVLDVELRLAHQLLAETAPANIHDHQAMLQAATGLFYRMRSLLAAVDAERGERRG